MQEWYLGWGKVSFRERCPQFYTPMGYIEGGGVIGSEVSLFQG